MKSYMRYTLVFLLALGAPFFFLGGPGYLASRSLKNVWDLGHIFFFALASFGLCDFFSTRGDKLSAGTVFWKIFFMVLGAGLAVELLQGSLPGRSPSIADLFRNQLGGLTGFTLFFSLNKALTFRHVRKLLAGTLLLLLLTLWPVLRAVIDEKEATRQYPELSDFETCFEISRWRHPDQLEIVEEPVRHGSKSLRVQLSTEQYSGTGLLYFPHDWSDYQWLHFSVFKQDSEEMILYVKVHDVLHKEHERAYTDRFHATFTLKSGWNDCKIFLKDVRYAPADREMDMHKIESFAIFVVSQKHLRVIYLDHVYLSN